VTVLNAPNVPSAASDRASRRVAKDVTPARAPHAGKDSAWARTRPAPAISRDRMRVLSANVSLTRVPQSHANGIHAHANDKLAKESRVHSAPHSSAGVSGHRSRTSALPTTSRHSCADRRSPESD
jgi:hypothetical protein